MKLDIVCEKHPKYQAKHFPGVKRKGTRCEACFALWLLVIHRRYVLTDESMLVRKP